MSYALATSRKGKASSPALALNGNLYDLALAARATKVKVARGWLDGGIEGLVAQWGAHTATVKAIGAGASAAIAAGRLEPLGSIERFAAAPYRPMRIFCAASNYIEHANEMKSVLAAKADSRPYMFVKHRNAVVGPRETVLMPPETKKLDWEVELAVVIGRRTRRISVARALSCVAGYSIVNDVSARDLNVRSDYPFKFDWFQGKCHDTFAPFGPVMVPAWLVKDPNALGLRLTVSGKVMQDDTTANMIWNVREQIAYLSTIVTLEPGDVIATGTPAGVGMGRGVYLKPGDVMVAEVEGIGALVNPVAAERVKG